MHPPRVETPRTEPAAPPLDFASAHFLPDLDAMRRLHREHKPGYYRRWGSSNGRQFEGAMTGLEAPAGAGWDALATSSGMTAAISLFWGLLDPGAHVVAGRELYGGTSSFLSAHATRLGLSTTFVASTPAAVRAAIRPDTRAVVLETITNPLVRVPDIAGIVKAARGVAVFVDNTFASPVLARPLEWGARAVWHSATKFLGGHADVLAGVVVGKSRDVGRIRILSGAAGFGVAPLDAWLAVRSLRTLDLRVRRSCENAGEIARRLERHRGVVRVHYPGLKSSPDHAVARRLLSGGFGAMASFELRGGLSAAKKVVKALRMLRLLPSLGDVETTVSHPASSSHASLSPAERRDAGIGDGLLRVSFGIEDVEDIWADINQALR